MLIFLSKVKRPALKDQSDSLEEQILVDLWKSAISMSGVQSVLILHGDLLVPKLHADS